MDNLAYTPIAINSKIETEEVLGPLPQNWEKAPWGKTNRHYFIDHNSKSTTWVDPRTYDLRKHDIRDIVAGELPYAWEEAYDEQVGIYYIDHTTQFHFIDAPWEEHVKEQVLQLQAAKVPLESEVLSNTAAVESINIEEQLENERLKRLEIEEAELKYNTLHEERTKIELQIKELEEKINMINSESPEEVSQEDQEKVKNLKIELSQLDVKIEDERKELELFNNQHEKLKREIEEYQLKIKELNSVNERLEQNTNALIEGNREAHDGINEMRQMIEAEALQRAALEDYIKQLKSEVVQLYDPNAVPSTETETKPAHSDAPLPEPGSAEEVELLNERLEKEHKEKERLQRITKALEEERTKAHDENESHVHHLPTWVKDLDINNEDFNQSLSGKVGSEKSVAASQEIIVEHDTGNGEEESAEPENEKHEVENHVEEEQTVGAETHEDSEVKQHESEQLQVEEEHAEVA
ncbi:Membrane-associated guanylate kinase, WW and PDZ domain-containing protein 2 [Clydaea vesicula]|uniref:Membrane-associated guanylate kinase, WW and PDZ domain-containing protein 2 n=1 Tax=Clydaea vesicula TaxID=447962 RepID=A0AAD5U258_9FUNG|nr:Membrane-associated guanylate kinase, WW and PDZ domain-containing protein 2 [Clydaea vesicula]KAJ3386240.1 Membrane-associated guanylate kinase, WW and PDZ domain-containing protein 2 [Lobulomyces angularis]